MKLLILCIALTLLALTYPVWACENYTRFIGDRMLVCTKCCNEFGCTETCV